ncbi:hypothetical protein F7984_10745 [Pradoshia sp. D12]|uniref:hypothetical protein n=1 Tax=Pradoshia sp. D12 TaxID=2651284 RepID=UPI00112E96B9|nr:hypothetical protein [Pradoshia sp. D12]QFK71672.1 hypothetical protein F7984_10745 [Pradoshia sp. D12]TPF73467.1 hypothetical protein FHY44_07145 [Bacillus sp. D12]
MYKQHEGYDALGSQLKKLKDEAEKILRKVKTDHPYIVTDNFQFYINTMEEMNTQLQNDIIAGYDVGVKRLHLQNLYMERMGQLFDLYKLKIYSNYKTLKESLNEALFFVNWNRLLNNEEIIASIYPN